jgi:hypothetical protein
MNVSAEEANRVRAAWHAQYAAPAEYVPLASVTHERRPGGRVADAAACAHIIRALALALLHRPLRWWRERRRRRALHHMVHTFYVSRSSHPKA